MVQVLKKGFLAGLLAAAVFAFGAPSTFVHHSGGWQAADQIYVHHLGANQRVQRAWINDGGTWRIIHRGLKLTDKTLTCSPGQVAVRIRGDLGKLEVTGLGGVCTMTTLDDEWSGQTGGDTTLHTPSIYEARMTIITPGVSFDPEFNQANIWYGIGQFNHVQWWGIASDSGFSVWRLEIRDTATQQIRATADFGVTQDL